MKLPVVKVVSELHDHLMRIVLLYKVIFLIDMQHHQEEGQPNDQSSGFNKKCVF